MKNRLLLLVFAFILSTSCALAQFNIGEKIKNKTLDRVDQKIDQGIDKALDGVEEGVKNSDSEKKKKGKKAATEEATDEEAVESTEESAEPSTPKPQEKAPEKLQSTSKYDFVPGDKVLFFEDFSQDAVGDFPALWTTSGSGEVKTLNLFPGNWLHCDAADEIYALMKDLALPENFIFEFDVVPTRRNEESQDADFWFNLYNGEGDYMNEESYPGKSGIWVTLRLASWQVGSYSEGGGETKSGDSEKGPIIENKLNHVIIWVQKARVRIYNAGQKVIDLPTIIRPESIGKLNRFRLSLWASQGAAYITNLRITTASPDMRSKLLTDGKIVSYGIYFDSGKDVVKPESFGSIKQIADILTQNPDVKIKIVGHTDADGDAAKNLDLSKRRAASVKSELSKTFGIDASRITTDGKGEGEPIGENTTSEGKSKNRRVEFIKQ